MSSDYIVCSENQDLDSRRVQRGHSIGVPPARKKNKEIRLGMRTRFDNIIILLDSTAKLLKQTRLFELNETSSVIYALLLHSCICYQVSIHPSTHPFIWPSVCLSVRPSVYFCWSVTFSSPFCFGVGWLLLVWLEFCCLR